MHLESVIAPTGPMIVAYLTLALLTAPRVPAPGLASDTTRCAAAAEFLRGTQRMVAVLEPDTIDDWRTRARQPGCRITAAGNTRGGIAMEAVRFYERLRAAGWIRSPDPFDAPHESSLRFRRDDTDCLFNVYEVPRLFTEAEFRVNEAVQAVPGETRYQVLTLCIAAAPAAPR